MCQPSFNAHNNPGSIFKVFMLQVGKLRHKEVKSLAEDHTTGKSWSNLALESVLSKTMTYYIYTSTVQ